MAEDPTRTQQAPRDPAGRGRGEVYEEYEAEVGPSRAELADQARSSRNWAYAAAFLGVLAAGLAAVAIIFAMDDEGGGGREGASRSSVTELREDIEALQEQIDDVEGQAEGADDASGQIEELDGTLSELSSSQESTSEQLTQLEERVDEVAQDAAQGGSGDTGGGSDDTDGGVTE
jgi:methyl-accepting chemotaxis protein